jgi:hypothetical protein
MKTRMLAGVLVFLIAIAIPTSVVQGLPRLQTSGWWTLSSGTYLYPNSVSYNVGVGTTLPSRKLQVVEGSLAEPIAMQGANGIGVRLIMESLSPGGRR